MNPSQSNDWWRPQQGYNRNPYRPNKTGYKSTQPPSRAGLIQSTAELGYLDSSRIHVDRRYKDIGAELICCVCHNILWKPVACARCENAFCDGCIRTWLDASTQAVKKTCPFNCQFQEKRPPPILNNLLSKLRIGCAYSPKGCRAVLSYDALEAHEQSCTYEQTPCQICDVFVSHRDPNNRHELRQCFETMHERGPDHIQKQFMKLVNTIEDNQRRIKESEQRIQALEAVLK